MGMYREKGMRKPRLLHLFFFSFFSFFLLLVAVYVTRENRERMGRKREIAEASMLGKMEEGGMEERMKVERKKVRVVDSL